MHVHPDSLGFSRGKTLLWRVPVCADGRGMSPEESHRAQEVEPLMWKTPHQGQNMGEETYSSVVSWLSAFDKPLTVINLL